MVTEIGSGERTSSTSQNKLNVKSTSEKVKKNINRKYYEKYLAFGFSWIGDENNPLPLCVVCNKKLSNESMVPSKLERHFMTKHAHLSQTSIGYFKNIENLINTQMKKFYNSMKISDKAQEASYAVAELVAQNGKNNAWRKFRKGNYESSSLQ